MPEILTGSAYVLAAFVAAMGIVLAIAGMMHWGKDRDHGLLPYIFYLVFLSFALEVLLSSRDYSIPRDADLLRPMQHPLAEWATRITSLFLVAAAAERIARYVVHPHRSSPATVLLLAAFGLYFFTNVVTSALFGAHRFVSHEPIYALMAGVGALLFTRQEGDTAVRAARNALFIFLAVGLALTLLRPEIVFRAHDSIVIPGLMHRLAGLANHPNTLGAFAVAFLLCLWSVPFSSRWVNALAWGAGCASLVLTQSKTAWVAFVLCAPCVAYFRHGGTFARGLREVRQSYLTAALIMVSMFMVAGAGAAFMVGAFDDAIAAFLQTRAGAELLTLTGRNVIWEIALQEWRGNPEFGYGLTIWDEAHRTALGLRSAHHAHNQFYQALAASGVVGAAGLLIYVTVLFWFAVQTARATEGLSLALFMLILVRSVTETPLSIVSYSQELVLHLLMLMVIASSVAPRLLAAGGGASSRFAVR